MSSVDSRAHQSVGESPLDQHHHPPYPSLTPTQWWDYIIDFTNPSRLPVGNLLDAYPELASRLASGNNAEDPDTEAAMKSLESTHAGFALTTGCPGAGKSTWATEVCDAVMEGQPGLKSLLLPVHLDLNTAPQQDDTAPSVNDDTAREMANRVCKIVRVAPFNNTTFHRLAGEDPGMFTEIKANIFNVGNFPGWGCLIDPSFIDPASTQCDHCTKSLCHCITISIRPEKPEMTPAGDIEAGVTATALYNKRDIIREPGKVHALPESRRG